ncbi:MAG: hypothetical protein LBE25_13385 [Arthrobacter sp.]|jgi:type II secretory pathway pseudopilin PulG|nr:hypothetical protein [Arthrobacter sp.]
MPETSAPEGGEFLFFLTAVPSGVWALIGVAITAALTWWAATQRTRNEAQTALIQTYRDDLSALRDRMTTAEALREEDRNARLAAEAEAREADDTIRDAHETLADYRQWRAAVLTHIDEGHPPPSPPPTWRMTGDADAYRRRHPDAP